MQFISGNPIIPLWTSCKMRMLCPHGSHHRLQFRNPNPYSLLIYIPTPLFPTQIQHSLGAPPLKPLIPLRTSCKMLILILHGFHHRLQFIYRNPSFRCGRPAKCSCEVYMDPIIDCSSFLETLSFRGGRPAKCACCVHKSCLWQADKRLS